MHRLMTQSYIDLQSSVLGLYFLGAAAAWSFGPLMRFVWGGGYACRQLASRVSGQVGTAASNTGQSAIHARVERYR
jgi:hypothetical protein